MKKILKNNKQFITFLLVLFIVSFALSIIYFSFLTDEVKESIQISLKSNSIYNYNKIINDLIIMSVLLITSFFIIGSPLSIIYLVYDFFSIGFLLMIHNYTYGISGIVFILIYIFLNKFIFYILYSIFIKRLIKISILVFKKIAIKQEFTNNNRLVSNFTSSLYLILIVLIYNILLYILNPLVLNKLAYLIK